MNDDYPIESLLRPPVEYYAAGTHLMLAAICLASPEAIFVLPSVAYFTASILSVRGLQRFFQGRKVRAYQKGLWRLPRYVMSSKNLPVSKHKLFLGLGFHWDGRHTQRLEESERRSNRKYSEPSIYYSWARQFEVRHENTPLLKHIAKPLRLDSNLNPVRPLPPVGGNPAIHAVGLLEGERPIYMDLADRVGHMLVLGATRVGKTRLEEILVAQDIRRGDCVIVFDPKGDADLFRRMYVEAEAAGRLDELHIFHLGYPDISERYNPVGEFGRITEVASRISSQLPAEGNSAAFREFAWRFTNVIARALVGLGRKPTYNAIAQYVTHIEPILIEYYHLWLESEGPQDWRDAVGIVESTLKDNNLPPALRGRDKHALALVRFAKERGLFDPVADGLRSAFEYDKTYFDKLTASLLPLMEKLTSGRVGALLSPDYDNSEDTRPILDWRRILREGGIVYVGLDALSDPEVSSAVSNSMFADLTSTAGQLYKHGDTLGLPFASGHKRAALSIHADEFPELIGDEFIPMLNKAGGAGYQVTAYTQTISDIEAGLGSRAKAGQVIGNFNTVTMLRVRNQETAETLTQQLKQVEVSQLTTISATTDSSIPENDTHFVSRTEQRETSQRVDLIHPADLVKLPKGQCFALLDGGKPFKLRLPLPDSSDLSGLPDDLEAVASSMEEKYATGEGWYAPPSLKMAA